MHGHMPGSGTRGRHVGATLWRLERALEAAGDVLSELRKGYGSHVEGVGAGGVGDFLGIDGL
jgi:hypothetical protein